MYLSREEENKNRAISMGISLGFLGLILLLSLYAFKIITPNPPFPEGSGTDGMEFNIGNLVEGTGNVENNGIGEAPKVVEKTEVTPAAATETKEDLLTSEVGEDINIKKNETETKTNNTTVVVPVKPKEKTAAELLADKFNKNKGKTGSGGDGNSGEAGNDGRPDGNPNTNGKGGTGGGPDDSEGDGGPTSGHGPPGVSFNLNGRKMLVQPPISKDTREEGTVVVEIVVDKTGKVIHADAVGRGTNTNSIMLKTKARQAALATKFNVGSEFEEQRGTITFVFSF